MSGELSENDDAQGNIVATLKQADEKNFEVSALQYTYDVEEGYIGRELFIDQMDQDDKSEGLRAANRIDLVSLLVGVHPGKPADVFIDGTLESLSKYDIDELSLRHAQRAGETLGQFVTRRAFDMLPIESGEDGSGYVTLHLRTANEHILELRSEGNYWISYGDEDNETTDGWSIRYYAIVQRLD